MKNPLKLLCLAAALTITAAVAAPLVLNPHGHEEIQIRDGKTVKIRYKNNRLTAENGASIGPEWHTACKFATTGNVNFTTNLDAGSTIDTSGTITEGDRILVWQQTAPAENGIYVAAATSGTSVRATDLNEWDEAVDAYVQVTSGTLYAGNVFRTTVAAGNNGVLGTTAMTWAADAGAAALALKAPLLAPAFTGSASAEDLAVSGELGVGSILAGAGADTYDFSASSGIFKTSTGANTLGGDTSVTGTIESADATTPILSTASGKTNTGYLSLAGKTSGSFKILPADATAQVVTLGIAAQTVGAATVTVPNQLGTAGTVVAAKASVAVSLTADDQAVTPGVSTVLQLSSDNATATNRTFTLSATGAITGATYVLIGPATNQCEIADTGIQVLSATWSPTTGDTLTLLFDGTNFTELARSNN